MSRKYKKFDCGKGQINPPYHWCSNNGEIIFRFAQGKKSRISGKRPRFNRLRTFSLDFMYFIPQVYVLYNMFI